MEKETNQKSEINAQVGAINAHTELIEKPEHLSFTKGEWEAYRKSEHQICHLVKTGDRYTVHVYESNYGIEESESWANAKLIAKAPELFQMLKMVTDELEYYTGKHLLIEKSRNLIKTILIHKKDYNHKQKSDGKGTN